MSQAPTMGAFTPAPPASPFGQPGDQPPPPAPPEPAASGARRLAPKQLALIGGAVAVAAAGAVAWVMLGSGDTAAETVAVPQVSARPGASAGSPSPSASLLNPAVLATRNPFGAAAGVATGVPDTNSSAQPAGAVSTVTSTVTQQVSVTVPVITTVTSTKSVTATATVTANPVYVFFLDWDVSDQAQLVVNEADQVAVPAGSTTAGVTYIGHDPADTNECIQVKRAGTADTSAESVCRGQAIKLG